MTKRLLVLAAAATVASAAPRIIAAQAIPDKPAPAPAAAPDTTKDIDPVGTYTTYLTVQGSPFTSITKIEKRADGTFGGTVTGEGIPPLPVNSVVVTKNKIHLSISAPDGSEALIDMWVTGNEITGSWSMAGDGSKLTGTKSP